MNLYLYHYTPAADDGRSRNYMYLDRPGVPPDYIERHRHLVSTKVEENRFFNIFIFPDSNSRTLYEQHHSPAADRLYLTGSLQDLEGDISALEAQYQLDTEESSIADMKCRLKIGRKTVVVSCVQLRYVTQCAVSEVLYLVEAGYQRKGMHASFCEAFMNGKDYFLLEDVRKAFLHLSRDKHFAARAAGFQKHFIDNFVQGESLFYCRW